MGKRHWVSLEGKAVYISSHPGGRLAPPLPQHGRGLQDLNLTTLLLLIGNRLARFRLEWNNVAKDPPPQTLDFPYLVARKPLNAVDNYGDVVLIPGNVWVITFLDIPNPEREANVTT